MIIEDFRSEVRKWLEATPRPAGLRDYGATPALADLGPAQAWQQLLARAGWACIVWPRRYGGREATTRERAVFAEECARAGVPRQLNIVGPDLVGPVLIAEGSDEQRERWLPRIRTGDDLWCQLFSETEAGSDLAAIRTKATQDGRDWLVDGRKVWSSGASIADHGLLLARTGSERFDLTMFAVPMQSTGIEVRPLRQMDGEAKFNEVTLDGVRLGPAALIGTFHGGWKLAMNTLGSERLNLGGQAVALLAHLESTLRMPAVRAPVARATATRLWARTWLLRASFDRMLVEGRPLADPSYSILKLSATELQRDLERFVVDIAGLGATAANGPLPVITGRFLSQPGQTIAGGTSEIQRNILAERVLGLPR